MYAKFIYFIVLLACSLFGLSGLSVAETASKKSSTEPSTEEQGSSDVINNASGRVGALNETEINQLALSKEVKAKEITWLDVNYAGGNGVTKVLALTEKPKSPDAQGAVLILHDNGQNADWPYLIRPLRKYLPDSGWFTLALSLPYDSKRTVPERHLLSKKIDNAVLTDALRLKLQLNASVKTKSSKKPKNEAEQAHVTTDSVEKNKVETPVDINLVEKQKIKSALSGEEKAEVNIQAALDYIHLQGYQNIIIVTYGAAANLALNHIKDIAPQISSKGFALVMVDPILKADYQDDLGSALGKGFKAPILDIVNSADFDSQEQAMERKASASVARAERYMQLKLIATPSATRQLTLLGRIRFWIERYAPGMQATTLQ